MSNHDVLGAHLHTQLTLAEDEVVGRWYAVLASAIAFTIGTTLPSLLRPEGVRVPVTFVAVLLALGITGWIGAVIGGGSCVKAAARVVLGGALALGATVAIGRLLGSGGWFG